ncbi:M14 family zinc carboxypeptidase [Catenuloplanes atrovinosus]|uniref:Peptidase M14 domain-containing protein n=1 Tax=Catenuloplanes atrovinosus TaxID=137266 RepID=A0AAE3YKG0_9ACTN|nr:M14 family zinc carboxypeptidase [Catenuloplanes atrovinosus]MDR7274059.1 hypothetical protein [Catenuloplanes atrovinosus]
MRSPGKILTGLLIAGLGVSLLPSAALGAPPDRPVRDFGNGPERNQIAAADAALTLAATAAAPDSSWSADRRGGGYPRRTALHVYPENPADKSIKLGLVPYHAIAPKLNALQAASDRVSAEVIGRSALGRELYLVTVTAPESAAETRRQAEWRRLIEDDPVRAARDRSLARDYKAPIWINANIHGNEWEGTDGSLRLIEQLATATDAATAALLRRTRVYFTVTNNPDGRIAGTRANGAGFDVNRDHVTSSQPESRAVRAVAIDAQPLVMLDEHGYTGTTLIEPCTPPHGQNYEYDLYLPPAYGNALGMEKNVNALGLPVDIPFRDFAPGDWDDWPPVFTPMYAMYHGAIGHTVEIPLRVNNADYDALPVAELRRRAAINTSVVEATIRGTLTYTDANRASLIAGQIEQFRRGWAGEPLRDVPDGFVPGYGPEDRYQTTFPRAYVIPAGGPAAARLVDHLIAHDIRVTRASRPFTLTGRAYPAGTYVVDMHQPKRGLANAMLEAGRDISAAVPQMYDISGWSHRLLWGAPVSVVERGALPSGLRPVSTAAPTGAVPAGRGDLLLTLADAADVRALNALLAAGVPARRLPDGTVVVPSASRREAVSVATTYGVRFTTAPRGAAGVPLTRPVIAAAAAADELLVLRDLGFEVRTISTAALNAGESLDGVSALYVSAGLSYASLTPAARAEVASVGAVITRGTTGARFNAEAALLPVTAVAGRSDANGVVSVVNGRGPVGASAPPHSFVYSPLWFTGLGAGVVAEQRYAATPLVAGHWRPAEDGTGGPGAAAGQAAVVSGVSASGTAAVLFGTEPLFRAHPKGLYPQVARALFWSVTAGVPAGV